MWLLKGIKRYKEVSAGLGFSDPSYFSRFFKINTGVAPKRYKEI
ncbi:helix-turn-helix domain-containing protein [Sphingobacterium siyangense]